MSDEFDIARFDYKQHEKQLAQKGKFRGHITMATLDLKRKPEGIQTLALHVKLETGQMVFPRITLVHPNQTVSTIGRQELAKLVKHWTDGKITCYQDLIGRRVCVEISHAPGKDGTTWERFKWLSREEGVLLNKPVPKPAKAPRPAEDEEEGPPVRKRKNAPVDDREEDLNDEGLDPETDFPSRSAVKRTPKAKPKWRPEADHTDDGDE